LKAEVISLKEPTIYTVATAHLDTSWHWTLERTIEEYLPRTLEENFRLFEEYPEYTFSFEGAYRYALVEEYYPELFEKLKGYVARGRWRVAGSAWENGDTNIPSPEALLRNILLGNRYFEEKFGKRSCDIFLPDCFGFGWALPGLAAHANLKGFTTQKLQWGCADKVPFALGRWQGPDGGEVFACPDGHDYASGLKKVRGNYYMKRALAMAKKRKAPPAALILHGVGDQGGAPEERSVKTVCRELAKNSAKRVRVLSAGSDQIFRELRSLPAAERNALPIYRGEWLMTDHGAGCYTSRTWSKRWNRQAEQLALAAEHACAFAGFMNRMEYPKEALDTAWRRVLAHQFHDDMTGTSNEISYRRNWDDLMASQQEFARLYTQGISAVANAMCTGFAEGRCAAVSNVTQWERREAVELRLPQEPESGAVRVLDALGRELPSQLNPDGKTVVFSPALEPLSVTLFDVRTGTRPCREDTGLYVSAQSLEKDRKSTRLNSSHI
jgi:alpha-mannosidase